MTLPEIRAALKRYYPTNQFAIAYEVASCTGVNVGGHLDAVVMSLWPSRGLTLTGIEIKRARNDFRREIKHPEKAEQLAHYLDEFYLCAPRKIVPIEEVPNGWGLLEVSENGSIRKAKNAIAKEASPITRDLLAALLRAMQRPIDPETLEALMAKESTKIYERFDVRVKAEVDRQMNLRRGGEAHWASLVQAIGGDPGAFYENEELAAAVKAVLISGVVRSWDGLKSLDATLAKAREGIQAAIADLAIGNGKA